MSKLIPDVQIGTLGGSLVWMALIILIIVAIFTTGLGPPLVAGFVLLVIVFVLFFALSRVVFRLKRGSR